MGSHQWILKTFKTNSMKEVHISLIRAGDAILHNGELVTVSSNNIKHCPFMGTTIFGDSYNLGYKPVIVVYFNRR